MTDVSNITHSLGDIYSVQNDITSSDHTEESPEGGVRTHRPLPPNWERVRSEQHNCYYYWNRESGKTSWRFPEEEAKEHSEKVRSHNYVNVAPSTKNRSSPGKVPKRLIISDSTHHSDSTADQSDQNEIFASNDNTSPPQPPRSSYVNIELVGNVSPLPSEPKLNSSPLLTQSDEEGSPLSPAPPIPSRNYSISDVNRSSRRTPADEHTPPNTCGYSSGSNSDLTGSTESTHIIPVQHTVTTEGHEYAVIDRRVKAQDEKTTPIKSPPPPVPLRVRERFAQDAHEAGYTEIAERTLRNRVYAELEQTGSTELINRSPRSPAAYAVIDLGKDDAQRADGRQRKLSKKVPRPYEIPTGSVENLCDPGYEQVRDKEEPAADGYMEVKKETQLSYRRTSSLGQLKTMRKSKELITFPLAERPLSRKESPPTGRGSPSIIDRDNLSQDSVFGTDHKYDLPSNSNKLSITLPRASTPTMPGYSRLDDLSKEAILLRSGVTLQRYRVLDSVSSLRSRPEDVSEDSSAGSDHDDSLEPVNKAIKSLESSLGISADNLSNPPVQLVRAPCGPPSWTKAQRRPHAYEPINHSSDESFELINQNARKQPLTASSIEMEWDETDFSAPKNSLKKVQDLAKQRSASQPNLLQDSDVFPHLRRPPRVSEEAFKLRKMRLMNHKYEDMEKGVDSSSVSPSGESVGDVSALNSAVKESWTEGEGAMGEGDLPKGWQRMKDENKRVYYWHISSGRTQYEKPTGTEIKRLSLSVDDRAVGVVSPKGAENKRRSSPTFRANYIGSWDVEEGELIQGQCVKVVHACINKITVDPSEKENTVFLQVHHATLRWLDSVTSSPTLIQPINKIRVWGIGLENEHDFGYVARDLSTKKHKCHVLRCEQPARAVARALLEAHQRDRQERRAKKVLKKDDNEQSKDSSTDTTTVTTKRSTSHSLSPEKGDMNERITCTYIGSCDVFQQQGIDIVNNAVSRLCMENNKAHTQVYIDVATSNIRISTVKDHLVIAEHRVRFLCFLGIAHDDRYCGYILDNGSKGKIKQLKFYGFRLEPNTDKLCLAIHRACQARYQRVLESNPDAKAEPPAASPREKLSPTKAKSSPNLFERLGSLRKTKKLLVEDNSTLQSFVVQYLGCQGVSKAEGLDAVRVPLQQMAQSKTPPHSTTPFIVDLDVTPAGIFITDPQKKVFNRKSFPVKNITYAVRVREYFAFIFRDSGKFNCHVFLQNEVDAGTVVSTIERILAPDNSRSPTK